MDFVDHYEVLSVPFGTRGRALTQALTSALMRHPDKTKAGSEIRRAVREAHRVLTGTERVPYDADYIARRDRISAELEAAAKDREFAVTQIWRNVSHEIGGLEPSDRVLLYGKNKDSWTWRDKFAGDALETLEQYPILLTDDQVRHEIARVVILGLYRSGQSRVANLIDLTFEGLSFGLHQTLFGARTIAGYPLMALQENLFHNDHSLDDPQRVERIIGWAGAITRNDLYHATDKAISTEIECLLRETDARRRTENGFVASQGLQHQIFG